MNKVGFLTKRTLHPARGLSLFKIFELIMLSVVGTILGVVLFGTATINSGPFSADLSIKPAIHGSTVVDLGPLGEISFSSHTGPLKVWIKVRSLSPETAAKFLKSSENLKKFSPNLSDELKKSFTHILMTSILSGIIASFLVVLLAFRRYKIALYAVIISLLFNLTVLSIAFFTYKPEAISQPRYKGLVTAAPTLIGSAKDISSNYSLYRDQMAKLLSNISDVYTLANSIPIINENSDNLILLHISDLHLNPEGWDLVNKLSNQFNVDIILDTGDISDHGTSIEDFYLAEIPKLNKPYLYVRGNHDSLHTQSVIASYNNAVVLDQGAVTTIQGVTFAGMGDTRLTPDKSKDNVEDAILKDSGMKFASTIAGNVVDFALIHDPQIATFIDGYSKVILAGHLHHQKVSKLAKGSLLMVEGSTGGSGLRLISDNKKTTPLQATVIYFSKSKKKVIAYDEVTLGGVGNPSVEISRKITE